MFASFIDEVLVRIIAWLLRETLGWLDEEGNPIRQDIRISCRDLIQKAKVSRGAIKVALNEAISIKIYYLFAEWLSEKAR